MNLDNQNLRGTSTNYKRAIGVFERRENVEEVLRALKDTGFNLDNVSLIARNTEEVEGAEELNEGGGNEAAEGAGIGATTGTVLGGIGGFLVGAGVLAIPGLGPALAAGVGISEIAATLAGAGIGAAAGGIIGALVGLGIPEDRARVYQDRVKAGDYLLMVTGTEDQVQRASSILRDRHIQEFEIYDAPDLYKSQSTTDSIPVTTGSDRVNPATTPMTTSTNRIDTPNTPMTTGSDRVNPTTTPITTGTDRVNPTTTPMTTGTDRVNPTTTPMTTGTNRVDVTTTPVSDRTLASDRQVVSQPQSVESRRETTEKINRNNDGESEVIIIEPDSEVR
jgi:hypothetical protein